MAASEYYKYSLIGAAFNVSPLVGATRTRALCDKELRSSALRTGKFPSEFSEVVPCSDSCTS